MFNEIKNIKVIDILRKSFFLQTKSTKAISSNVKTAAKHLFYLFYDSLETYSHVMAFFYKLYMQRFIL